MIRAAIFDLDGLLVDSEPVWFRIRAEMCDEFGLTWTDDDQKALMGKSTQAWIGYVTAKMEGHVSARQVEQRTIEGMVRSYSTGGVAKMPGADEALAYCRTHLAVGLASGSPKVLIDAALDAFAWRGIFLNCASSDEVPKGKPDPDVYLEVMNRMGISPGECVVVEDSGSGILAGRAAGAHVVAVPNERLRPAPEALRQADVALVSLADLPGHLSVLQE